MSETALPSVEAIKEATFKAFKGKDDDIFLKEIIIWV